MTAPPEPPDAVTAYLDALRRALEQAVPGAVVDFSTDPDGSDPGAYYCTVKIHGHMLCERIPENRLQASVSTLPRVVEAAYLRTIKRRPEMRARMLRDAMARALPA
jgi:hypothetical protein